MNAPSWSDSWRGWRTIAFVLLGVSVLWTAGDGPRELEPDDPTVYVEAAESLTEGRYESASETSGLPRYPPGFPLMLAPFVAAGGVDGARVASWLFGIGLPILVWVGAWRLAGYRAAAVAAVLWIASPLVSGYATDIMSDAPAAAMVLLALLAVSAGRWGLAGAALAWSAWIRLIHVVFLVALGRNARGWTVGAAVLVPLAVFQAVVYGRMTGYDEGQAQFALGYVFERRGLLYVDTPSPWPNWQFVPGLLFGLRSGVVPLLIVFVVYELWARRREPEARFAAVVIGLNVLVYLPYYFQASRFMFPAVCLMIVFGASGVVRAIGRFRPVDAQSSELGC